MILIVILVFIEAFSLAVLRQHLFIKVRTTYFIFVLLHIILSIWFWVLFADVIWHDSFFDTPDNVWRLMALAGMICAVILPRLLLIVLHFSGKWIRRKKGGHIRWLTSTGLIIAYFVLIVVAIGTLHGKFNFKYETVPVKIVGLPRDLEGLKIVQISDLHMSTFYHNPEILPRVIDRINRYEPDIIFNTGDFITIGWREFGRNDTVLSKAKSKYGNFAIMGNHDSGIYDPEYSEAELENHKLIIHNLVTASGYRVLNNEFVKVRVRNARVGIIGVTTGGRHPYITHGNIDSAIAGLDSVDLQILLTHDPNHWIEQVEGKHPGIRFTVSGHTHGMQMGIMTKKIKWSPAKYFYPHWNGLYQNGNQIHYVNRGLGVLAIPFRIWMPPEITIFTLHSDI